MRRPIDIGGFNKDFNSRLSRANCINGYIEFSNDGKFKRIRRANGLVEVRTVGVGPIRGMFAIQDVVYVVSGPELYEVTASGETLLGNVGGITSQVRMNAVGTDDFQIMLISDKVGYTYDSTNGLLEITDPDFNGDFSVASLNLIFWVNDPDSNVFSGSDAANGQVWDPTRRANAEQAPDVVMYVARQRSSLRIMGRKTIEHWQTDINDPDVPVRPILGGTIDRGVLAKESVAQFQDNIFWLADNGEVWQISGESAGRISDLSLDYAIQGNGQQPGYVNPELAQGFFIDHPVHKQYVLTFPVDKVTWVYDVSTKLWHIRESKDVGRWRGNNSVRAFDTILIGDFRTNQIFDWREDVFDEDGEILSLEIVTPAIRYVNTDLFVYYVEAIMEVGTAGVGEPPAKMQIKYSRDGGATYLSKSDIELGAQGDRNVRVLRRQFGRTKRMFEFVLKLIITDKVPVYLYELWADVNEDR
jgi:hypothetical protein